MLAIDYDYDVDASGLNCPLPLLRLKKALIAMSSGEVVRVIATDPAAHLDFGVFAEQSGNPLLEVAKSGDQQVFYFQKK
jgi:tRNA 2-thiouridine synthesizing protein A